MTPFSPLASLDPLGGTAQAVTKAASAVSDAASTGIQKAIFGGLTLSQVVIILMGILLIGAGLFSMSGTRQIIVSTGRAAATAATAA